MRGTVLTGLLITRRPLVQVQPPLYMTMNGQMNKYKESLKNTPKPVMPSEILNINIDLKELIAYAKAKNISPADLSEQEKQFFIKKN